MDKATLILKQLKANPFLTQQQLADQIGLSRSAVANYIADLIRQGKIKGRAYVLGDENRIVCLGGANVDRKAVALEAVRYGSSNPVTTTDALGGVARNVAENLVQLGCSVSLFSRIGNDKEGQSLLEDAAQKGIQMDLSEVVSDAKTGTYTALIDLNGEMAVSLADMGIYDQLSLTKVEKMWPQLAMSHGLFMDTNFPAETLGFIVKKCHEDQVPLFVDPVSSLKAKKLPADLTGVHILFPNLEEAEELSGISIQNDADLEKATHIIQARGAQIVVVTLGSDGLYYAGASERGKLSPFQVDIVDVTGAGDALTAGVIAGLFHGETLSVACRWGMAAAALALTSPKSVATDLSVAHIQAALQP